MPPAAVTGDTVRADAPLAPQGGARGAVVAALSCGSPADVTGDTVRADVMR